MRRLTKNDYFQAGLCILEKEGFTRLTIDKLCTELSITKGSLYHHFANIDTYIEALMQYWLEQNTYEYISQAENITDPVLQYSFLSDMVIESSYKAEQVIRAWSFSNPTVKRYVEKADKTRLEYIENLKQQQGMDAVTAHRSAIMEYALLIGLQQLYPDLSKKEIKELHLMFSKS